ncbi:MAG: hypothetical protein J6O51_07335 [Bacteroidales bacterium]|nr:hypothetical protein [Bacteroidales bacterium]
MKLRALLVIACVLVSAPSFSQVRTWRKSFSIELGSGIKPLHMTMSPSRDVRYKLGEEGKAVDMSRAYYPVITVTGAWRFREHSELALTGEASWSHHKVIQYGIFGTDPEGKPRYDLNNSTPAGWKNSTLIPSLTFRYRYLWNPYAKVVAYSGVGVGFIPTFFPIPEILPIAARYGGNHFYGFAELTMGPVASYVHLGLGWRF